MALKIEMNKLKKKIKEVIGIQNKLDTIPNVADFSLDANEERRVLEQMIGYHLKVSGYIAKLNTRLNMVVAGVNKLPVEVLAHIVFLTNSNSEKTRDKHPYISYTWVCHHWRWVLIQTPYLWTSIRLGVSSDGDKGLPITPFMRELIDRSKSAPLDIKLSHRSAENLPMLADFFAQEKDRINTLYLRGNHADLIPLVLVGKQFSSLRGIVYDTKLPFGDTLPKLIPCIITANHLVTLDINFWHTFPIKLIDQLVPTFGRVQKLRLGVYTQGIIGTILDSLRKNTKLRALRILTIDFLKSFDETTWPELELLSVFHEMFLKGVCAPKLSSLDVSCGFPIAFDSHPVLDKFDYPSIKYLNLLEHKHHEFHHILGLNEIIPLQSEFSITSQDLLNEIRFINEALATEEMLTDSWTRGYLRIGFHCAEVFTKTLKGALSTIFPRMTGLQELCLMSHFVIDNEDVCFEKILIHVPSIEKLMIPVHGGELPDFIRRLGNGSLCPRLKHVSYMVSYFRCFSLKELKKFSKDVGKLLVECLESRQKGCVNVLEYIIFGNCPPLSDTCIRKCRSLGTTVVTEEDFDLKVEDVIVPELETNV